MPLAMESISIELHSPFYRRRIHVYTVIWSLPPQPHVVVLLVGHTLLAGHATACIHFNSYGQLSLFSLVTASGIDQAELGHLLFLKMIAVNRGSLCGQFLFIFCYHYKIHLTHPRGWDTSSPARLLQSG